MAASVPSATIAPLRAASACASGVCASSVTIRPPRSTRSAGVTCGVWLLRVTAEAMTPIRPTASAEVTSLDRVIRGHLTTNNLKLPTNNLRALVETQPFLSEQKHGQRKGREHRSQGEGWTETELMDDPAHDR